MILSTSQMASSSPPSTPSIPYPPSHPARRNNRAFRLLVRLNNPSLHHTGARDGTDASRHGSYAPRAPTQSAVCVPAHEATMARQDWEVERKARHTLTNKLDQHAAVRNRVHDGMGSGCCWAEDAEVKALAECDVRYEALLLRHVRAA